jgi:hypothetical protein
MMTALFLAGFTFIVGWMCKGLLDDLAKWLSRRLVALRARGLPEEMQEEWEQTWQAEVAVMSAASGLFWSASLYLTAFAKKLRPVTMGPKRSNPPLDDTVDSIVVTGFRIDRVALTGDGGEVPLWKRELVSPADFRRARKQLRRQERLLSQTARELAAEERAARAAWKKRKQ